MVRGAWRTLAITGTAVLCPLLRPGTALADGDPGSLLQLRQGAVAVDVGGGSAQNSGGVTGNAALTLSLPDLPVHAQASASTGEAPGTATGLWQKRDTKVEADFTALAPARVNVQADEQSSETAAPQPEGVAVTGSQVLLSDKHSASATASLPIGSVTLTTGTGMSSESAGDTARAGADASETRTHIETSTSEIHATAEWHPIPGVDAELGLKDQDAQIGWSGTGEGRRVYSYLEPSAEVTAHLWPDAEWKLGVEREVSDYSDGTYAELAAMPASSAPAALEPDHTWTARTSLTQSIGALKLEASVARSEGGSVTEIAAMPAGAAPASTPLAARMESDVTASLPLGGLGLNGFSLSANAHLASSRVRDPVTGLERRANGEEPFNSHVALTHDLARNLSVGLRAGARGAVTYYQPNAVSTVASAPDIGAFISYRPGPFELDLNADGLSGARTASDNFYATTRADSGPIRSDTRYVDGPSFTLALKKPL